MGHLPPSFARVRIALVPQGGLVPMPEPSTPYDALAKAIEGCTYAPDMPRCPYCGTRNTPETRSCPSCGGPQ